MFGIALQSLLVVFDSFMEVLPLASLQSMSVMKVGSCKIIVVISIQFWKWELLEGSVFFLPLIYCSDRTDLLKTVVWRVPLYQIWYLCHSSNWTGVEFDWRQFIFVFLNQILLWLFSKILFGVAKSSRLNVGFLKSWFFRI